MSLRLPQRILITGASGYLGSVLVRALTRYSEVESIVVLDVNPPQQVDERVRFVRHDVRRPWPDAALELGLDAVVHLAFPLDHRRSWREIEPFSIDATEHVLRAAARTGARKIVLCSSTTVYGAYPGRGRPYTEKDQPRPNRGYHYAWGKLRMEQLATQRAPSLRFAEVVIVRPSIVLGPHADNYILAGFRDHDLVARDLDPPLQLLHEEDFADSILALLSPGAAGVFNVAPDDHVRRTELDALFGVNPKRVSFLALKARLAVGWHLRRPGAVSPAMASLISYPWLVANHKLAEVVGYRCKRTSMDALLAFSRARRKRHREARVATS